MALLSLSSQSAPSPTEVVGRVLSSRHFPKMMRRPIQSRCTHEIEGPAMRLEGIGGANRPDRVGGAGRTLVKGTVDEPSTVTVNSEPAPLRPLPGGSSFLYSKELNLGPSEKRLEVEATDPNGNVARRSYTVSVGGVERTLAHDLNGNVTQEAVAGGKTCVYEWDAINRLTAIQSDATPLSGSWRSEFTYDGQSRRVRIVEKTWSGTARVVESDHRYLWCGTEICQKRNSTGATVVARYYDQGEQQTVGSTTTDYYYTRDHLGSIREVIKPSTNTAGHEIHLRYDYTAWGERSKLSGGADVEWGFTGHHYHAKSGLHLALYRAYDANLGRRLSEDPLGEAGGVNLYGYVVNNPIVYRDELGLAIRENKTNNDCSNWLSHWEVIIETNEGYIRASADPDKGLLIHHLAVSSFEDYEGTDSSAHMIDEINATLDEGSEVVNQLRENYEGEKYYYQSIVNDCGETVDKVKMLLDKIRDPQFKNSTLQDYLSHLDDQTFGASTGP